LYPPLRRGGRIEEGGIQQTTLEGWNSANFGFFRSGKLCCFLLPLRRGGRIEEGGIQQTTLGGWNSNI